MNPNVEQALAERRRSQRAEIYQAIDRVLKKLDRVGEKIDAPNPFLFRGKMMPPGSYRIRISRDPETRAPDLQMVNLSGDGPKPSPQFHP